MLSTTTGSPSETPSGQTAPQSSPRTRTLPSGRQSLAAMPSAPMRASTPVAGRRRRVSRIQNVASAASTASAERIRAIPQPGGSQ